MWEFISELSYSTDILMPVPHCLNYCSFVVSLEVGKCEFSNFVFQDYIGWSGSLKFPYVFSYEFGNFCKEANWDFDRDCVWEVFVFGDDLNLLTVLIVQVSELGYLSIYLGL